MLPGKARKLPSPKRLRSRLATKAIAIPHYGPSNTAENILTICCTGAHLLPATGILIRLPITATAVNTPASANFVVFLFISGYPPFLIWCTLEIFQAKYFEMDFKVIISKIQPKGFVFGRYQKYIYDIRAFLKRYLTYTIKSNPSVYIRFSLQLYAIFRIIHGFSKSLPV